MTDREDATGGRTFSDIARGFLSEDGERATAFLRQQWLSRLTALMRRERRAAGLTQAEVAARMGTTQSRIAVLERGAEGGFSVRRFIDYLVACGVQPFDVETVPAEELRAFLCDEPEAERTPAALAAWVESRSLATRNIGRGHVAGNWRFDERAASIGERLGDCLDDSSFAFVVGNSSRTLIASPAVRRGKSEPGGAFGVEWQAAGRRRFAAVARPSSNVRGTRLEESVA